jgi:hypothetical protein
MALLGERNWYLPKWLGWLPDMTHDEALAAPPAPEAPEATRPQAAVRG